MRSLTLALCLFTALAPAADGITITGAIERPTTVKFADLQAKPQTLLELVESAGLKLDANRKHHRLAFALVVTGRDGYAVTFGLGELLPEFGNKAVTFRIDANGAKLLVPGDESPSRGVRDVVRITVIDPLDATTDRGQTLGYSKADLGKPPTGWTATQTGEGQGSVWRVEANNSAPSKSGVVLAQTASGPKPMFNLCLHHLVQPADLTLSVAFQPVAGDIDQGGGLVWRVQDAKNYWIARFNPLEDNFRLYTVIDGVRKQLATREELKLSKEWHTLSIRHVGPSVRCSIDGVEYLSVESAELPKPGRVGLWTKADARTRFDAITVGRP